jgi:predicted RNA methylase
MAASSAFDPKKLFQLYSTPDSTAQQLYTFAKQYITQVEGVNVQAVVDLGAGTGRLIKPWIECSTVHYFIAIEGSKAEDTLSVLKNTLKEMKAARGDEGVKCALFPLNFFDQLELSLPEGVVTVFLMNPTFAYCKLSSILFTCGRLLLMLLIYRSQGERLGGCAVLEEWGLPSSNSSCQPLCGG